jgi:hypothetical protein
METSKEYYSEPVMIAHDLLRDITAVTSGVKLTDKTGADYVG